MQIIASRPQCSGEKSFGCVFSTQRTHTPPPQLFAIAHLCSFVGHRRHNCHNSMYASVVTIHSSFSTFPLLDSSALRIKQQKSFPFLDKAVKDDDPSVYSDVCNISGQKCWFKQDHLSCARKRARAVLHEKHVCSRRASRRATSHFFDIICQSKRVYQWSSSEMK